MVIQDVDLRALAGELRESDGECPFVAGAKAEEVALRHYSGGRDSTWVVVERREAAAKALAQVEIRYAKWVAGTAIIYDGTARAMQGKARPFMCDLTGQRQRVYALLPVQIEGIRVRAGLESGRVRFRVAFLDAGAEALQAALPFELRLLGPNARERVTRTCATSRSGEYDAAPDFHWPAAGENWRAVVRSLLTGDEAAAEFTTPS
jgi:hypothetical protein